MIRIEKNQRPVLIVNLIALAIFAAVYATMANYEFLTYIGVIVCIFVVLVLTNARVRYPADLLWGLTLWSLLHMLGGCVPIGEERLYELILIPVSEKYGVFRYDQFVHIIGFGVATLMMYHLLRPLLKPDVRRGWSFSILIVMAGLGVGALNEVIEFLITVVCPETGVGGYLNTSLDLVADLIGALLALAFIRVKESVASR